MSTALKRFKTWIFESRSFIFSWYRRDRNQLQEPTKTLIELPPSLREKLIEATGKLDDNPSDTDAIRTSIDEAFERWRNYPQNAENSIVILTSPVMVVSRIIITILQQWSTQKQVSVKVLPWNQRPAVDSIYLNLKQYLEQEASSTPGDRPQVMVIPNLSWCFLRSMDGLDGIDYLQEKLFHDSSRFWIVAADRFSWNYLNSISDIEADCGNVFSLPELTGDSLQQWLKPISSELNISFAEPRLESRILEGDKDPETIYFEDLALVSRGVSVVALHIFLASIHFQPFDEDEQQGILEAQNPELPDLPDLTTAHHYLLYFLLLHGDMTLPALAHSIGDKQSKVLGQIKFLRQEGLVRGEDEVFAINPIHYPKLKQELISNNFIVKD